MAKVRPLRGEGYAAGTVTVNPRLGQQDGTEGYASLLQPAARGFTTPGPVPPLSRVRVAVPTTVVARPAPTRPPCGACLRRSSVLTFGRTPPLRTAHRRRPAGNEKTGCSRASATPVPFPPGNGVGRLRSQPTASTSAFTQTYVAYYLALAFNSQRSRVCARDYGSTYTNLPGLVWAVPLLHTGLCRTGSVTHQVSCSTSPQPLQRPTWFRPRLDRDACQFRQTAKKAPTCSESPDSQESPDVL